MYYCNRKKMFLMLVNFSLLKWPKSNVKLEGYARKTIMAVCCGLKNLFLGITVRHHSASLVVSNSYPRDRFQTIMIYSYNLSLPSSTLEWRCYYTTMTMTGHNQSLFSRIPSPLHDTMPVPLRSHLVLIQLFIETTLAMNDLENDDHTCIIYMCVCM